MTTKVKPARSNLYETDFAAWAAAQAEALRAGRLDELDLENLAEEMGDLAKSERRAVESHLETLIMDLLKWRHQSDRRSISWDATIRLARSELAKLLRESPSLRRELPELLDTVYPDARTRAAGETGLPYDTFPSVCPFTLERVTGDWMP